MTEAPVNTRKYHEPAGCHLLGRPHTNPCVKRGTEAGRALTEVRTVLSRAETALALLSRHYGSGPEESLERPRLPKPPTGTGSVDAGEPPIDRDGVPFDDPDLALMCAALRQTVSLLTPWTRTGKTTHWVRPGPYEQLVTAGPPEWYEEEVGDEQFMAVQAVLGQVRARLAERLGFNQWLERAVLHTVDEFMREKVEEQDDEDQDDWVECGAVYVDPDRPERPSPPPCGKRHGHEHGPTTDWKRMYHSNGSWKWLVDGWTDAAKGDTSGE